MNRSKIILEQHAEKFVKNSNEDDEEHDLNEDLIDLLTFIGTSTHCVLSRYILLDTLQVASSIYHKKLTEE